VRLTVVCRVAPPHLGGMERVVGDHLQLARAEGWDVRLVTTSPRPDGQPSLAAGPCTAVLPRRGPGRYPWATGWASVLAGSNLVHVHGVDGLTDGVVAAAPCPVVVSTHGAYFHSARQGALKALWLRTLTWRTLRRATEVWFTSARDQHLLRPAAEGLLQPSGLFLPQPDPRPR